MKITHSAGVIIATALVQIGSLFYPSLTLAANLTVAKNTLQSSRMSFYGRVKSPTTAGSSHVWIYTVASAPANSITTAGLKPGDTLTIGAGTSYVIANIVDDDEFNLADLFECLRFINGELQFSSDYLRGRCMKTDITVRKNGHLTLNTRNRGKTALRWLDRLQGKKMLKLI